MEWHVEGSGPSPPRRPPPGYCRRTLKGIGYCVVIPEARKRLMPKGPLTSSQSGNCPSITAVHDHGVGRTVLLQLTKQPVWLLQLEVRSGLSEARPQPRGGGSGLDRRGGKDEHGDAANTAGCDRASESRIKGRLRDATPMRSIGMLDLREVLRPSGSRMSLCRRGGGILGSLVRWILGSKRVP